MQKTTKTKKLKPGQLIRLKPGSPSFGWFIENQVDVTLGPVMAIDHNDIVMYLEDLDIDLGYDNRNEVIKGVKVLHQGRLAIIQANPTKVDILCQSGSQTNQTEV